MATDKASTATHHDALLTGRHLVLRIVYWRGTHYLWLVNKKEFHLLKQILRKNIIM